MACGQRKRLSAGDGIGLEKGISVGKGGRKGVGKEDEGNVRIMPKGRTEKNLAFNLCQKLV